jgi:phosphoglycolate phosphatase-like HAD superfamily hydrolase
VLKLISVSHDQILISNTRPPNLWVFMAKLGLDQYFAPSECSAVDGHTDPKATKLDKLLSYLNGKNFEEVVVIGDSRGDMALGSKVGAY